MKFLKVLICLAVIKAANSVFSREQVDIMQTITIGLGKTQTNPNSENFEQSHNAHFGANDNNAFQSISGVKSRILQIFCPCEDGVNPKCDHPHDNDFKTSFDDCFDTGKLDGLPKDYPHCNLWQHEDAENNISCEAGTGVWCLSTSVDRPNKANCPTTSNKNDHLDGFLDILWIKMKGMTSLEAAQQEYQNIKDDYNETFGLKTRFSELTDNYHNAPGVIDGWLSDNKKYTKHEIESRCRPDFSHSDLDDVDDDSNYDQVSYQPDQAASPYRVVMYKSEVSANDATYNYLSFWLQTWMSANNFDQQDGSENQGNSFANKEKIGKTLFKTGNDNKWVILPPGCLPPQPPRPPTACEVAYEFGKCLAGNLESSFQNPTKAEIDAFNAKDHDLVVGQTRNPGPNDLDYSKDEDISQVMVGIDGQFQEKKDTDHANVSEGRKIQALSFCMKRELRKGGFTIYKVCLYRSVKQRFKSLKETVEHIITLVKEFDSEAECNDQGVDKIWVSWNSSETNCSISKMIENLQPALGYDAAMHQHTRDYQSRICARTQKCFQIESKNATNEQIEACRAKFHTYLQNAWATYTNDWAGPGQDVDKFTTGDDGFIA